MRPTTRLLVSLLTLLAGAACEKAEFAKPQPEAVVITISSGVISADGGAITAHVQALEEGVALLEYPVDVSVGGACSAPAQSAVTDAASGVATVTFTGLVTAGACSLTADAGVGSDAVTASVSFEVVPGAPASLSLSPGQSTVSAGAAVSYSIVIADAAANPVAVGASLFTDSPGAVLGSGGSIQFRRAGSWTVFAEIDGYPSLVDASAVTVNPGAAAQITASVAQTAVGQQQTLDVTCKELDAFGNVRNDPFTAADVTTDPAAGNVVEDATPGLFHVSGFSTFGVYTVTCDRGAFSDTKAFTVIPQAAANSVVATADRSQIEAGTGVLTVVCKEVDGFGNDAGTSFDAPANFFTDVAATIAEPAANTFTVTGVTVTGTFTATCDNGTDSDSEGFLVVDTTAPAASTTVSPAAGPYAAGTTLTVSVPSADAVGLASASIGLVSGPATFLSNTVVGLGGAASATPSFDVRLDGTAGAPSTVVLRLQVVDTTGNIRQPADVVVDVNAAGTFVVTTLGAPSVEASDVLAVTCREHHAITGAATATTFSPGASEVTTTAPGAAVGGAPGNTFTVSGFDTKGTFSVTCAKGAASDVRPVTVYDVTPPDVTQAQLTGATGPNGVTADSRYAPGTTLTITVDAADVVGIGKIEMGIVGPAAVANNPFFPAAGTRSVVDHAFAVTIDAGAATFAPVTLRVQASDTTGNVRQAADIALVVDPGAGIAVAAGVTLRTLVELAQGDPVPVGIGSDGTDLFVQRASFATGNVTDVVKISGTAGPATLTPWITSGFPANQATGGVTALASPFGGKRFFHTLGAGAAAPQVAVESGAGAPFSHANFDPTPSDLVDPSDLTFGDLGVGSRIYSLDRNGVGARRIYKSISSGEVAVYYDDTADGRLASCTTLVKDPGAARLLLADPAGTSVSQSGAIHTLVDSGSDTGNVGSLTLTGSIPANDAADIAVGASKILIAGGSTGAVYRVSGTTVDAPITSGLGAPVGLAVKSGDGDSLHVLDVGVPGGGWRVYRVTGY